ncbi:MAG: hypothetical protein ACE5HE_10265 [Phycisphaerae bacterium]
MRQGCVWAIALAHVMLVAGCGNLPLALLQAMVSEAAALDTQTPPDETVDQVNPDDLSSNADTVDQTDPLNDVTSPDQSETDVDDSPENTDVAEGGGASNTDVVDLSAFGQFSFARAPGLGFCPPLDQVHTASIVANGDGSYILNATVLRAGTGTSGACIGTLTVPCATTTQLEARTLSVAEVSALAAAFSEVHVEQVADPVCNQVVVDPCVVNQFAWDAFLITDYKCSGPRLSPEEAGRIISLLEQLRTGR